MPNYDLSSALEGRVVNQTVDMLMISNTVVWEAQPAFGPNTIFDGGFISLGTFHDIPEDSWLGSQFHKPSGPDLEIVAIGVYVPSGSDIIGRFGHAGFQPKSTPFISGVSYTNVINDIGNRIDIPTITTPGWNWIEYGTPKLWTDSNPYIIAGYTISNPGSFGYYLFNSDISTAAINSSPDSLFDLVAVSGGSSERRSWFASSGHNFEDTGSRSYGIDILVQPA